MVTIYSVRL